MINANALIGYFQYMYDNNWGYIFGKSGQKWTQAMQDRATNEMAKKYGSRWIGHYVTDCSGAFVWAYKQAGESIYHGSDTIFRKYCSSKGKLVYGVRGDLEPIKPGTAVFLLKDGKRHHIGLYVGDDMVIEAKGTLYGVTVSRLNHWDEWGELKDVNYDSVEPVDVKPVRRMLRRGCSGDDVKALQELLNIWGNNSEMLATDGKFGKLTEAAVKCFQTDKGLIADGIVGPQTWAALDKLKEYEQPDSDDPVTYTATISGLSKDDAEKLTALFPQAVIV